MYDVIIVGGSFAGLSAAMTLGRSLRNVLIIDHGKPCNRFTPQAHNFITHDGKKPGLIAKEAKTQVKAYHTVSFETDKVTEVSGGNNCFKVSTKNSNSFFTKKLLFATGLKDILPDISGLAECWGESLVHCPYCHGYEFRSKKTGVLANGEMALHYAELLTNWTHDLTVFTNGAADFDKNELETFKVKLVEDPISHIRHQEGYLYSIVFQNGLEQSLDVMYHGAKAEQQCPIPIALGCEMNEQDIIQVNSFQETSIPGVYAAGDCTNMFRALSVATASGTMAGVFINKALIQNGY